MADLAWIGAGETAFVCRHGHEAPLVEELHRLGAAPRPTPLPGLVAASSAAADLDPVWALQTLPRVRVLRGASVRALAEAAAEGLSERLDATEASWDWHWLLPATLRGNPRPPMQRRAGLVQAGAADWLQRRRRRLARRRVDGSPVQPAEYLAQHLLLDAETMLQSVAPCRRLAVGSSWPSPLPAGHAAVPDDPAAPASSYRKLEEGFALLGRWPAAGELAVDLGASPGGWTRVLRRYGARVIAVDRAPLAADLEADADVDARIGDAFRFEPDAPLDWLVSDIVAYPERIIELLGSLGTLAPERGVVQMKFRGDVDWAAIDTGLQTAAGQGYAARARHVFNDKNEVTIALRRAGKEAIR
ncbi:MAG: hypothetical protein H6747_10160 [Deltaproteobacteria bacterium]|nr:hypothetical protein [Deltaproteobacteria bacterium]